MEKRKKKRTARTARDVMRQQPSPTRNNISRRSRTTVQSTRTRNDTNNNNKKRTRLRAKEANQREEMAQRHSRLNGYGPPLSPRLSVPRSPKPCINVVVFTSAVFLVFLFSCPTFEAQRAGVSTVLKSDSRRGDV